MLYKRVTVFFRRFDDVIDLLTSHETTLDYAVMVAGWIADSSKILSIEITE